MPRGLRVWPFEDQSTLRAASLCSIPESSCHHGHHHVICRVSGGEEMFRYGRSAFFFTAELPVAKHFSSSRHTTDDMMVSVVRTGFREFIYLFMQTLI